jgi:heme exporter protein A
MKIEAAGVGKDFGVKKIFRDINFEVSAGESIAIVGPNGAGKTTLVRIICGLIRPSRGEMVYSNGTEKITRENFFRYLGLVGPYLELYEELTALENMRFFARMRGIENADERITELLDFVGLHKRGKDQVRTYSSGMRQRLKYVFALLAKPEVLILDEPTSNLDVHGIDTVYRIMEEQKKDKILVIATNDQEDLKYGDRQVAVVS